MIRKDVWIDPMVDLNDQYDDLMDRMGDHQLLDDASYDEDTFEAIDAALKPHGLELEIATVDGSDGCFIRFIKKTSK